MKTKIFTFLSHMYFISMSVVVFAVGIHPAFSATKIVNPQNGHSTRGLGGSNAISGDILVSGAPITYQQESPTGAARIWERNLDNEWEYSATIYPEAPYSGNQFGSCVAMDGQTILISNTSDSTHGSFAGAVHVYTFNGSSWLEQAKLYSSDIESGDRFGCAMQIEGDLAIIGANYESEGGYSAGAAYVFTRSGGVWTQQAKLMASNASSSDYFGSSIALDGNTILIGATEAQQTNTSSGLAYVFTGAGATWTEEAILEADDGSSGDYFGAVALTGDMAVIGASGAAAGASSSGAAYIFTRSVGVWTQQQKLTSNLPTANGRFGKSIAFDGNTIAISEKSYTDPGNIHIFTDQAGSWERTDTVELTAASSFGSSLLIQGTTIIIGDNLDDEKGDYTGAVYSLEDSGSGFEVAQKLTADYESANDWFGYAVAISGNLAMASAVSDDNYEASTGSVYVLERSDATWAVTDKIFIANGGSTPFFGSALSLNENTAIIGAFSYEASSFNFTGAAFVYERNAGSWSQEAILLADDAASGDSFGVSASLDNDTVVIGANGESTKGIGAGAAYVFVRNNNTWDQQAKLMASDGADSDDFGVSVSLDGNTALIGTLEYSLGKNNTGSAYIFTRTGETWTQKAKLVSSDQNAGDNFGASVSLYGDTALIGAPADSDYYTHGGSAYIFKKVGEQWIQQQKLLPSNPLDYDSFGYAVSLSNGMALITALESRVVYVFTYEDGTWSQREVLTAEPANGIDSFGNAIAHSGGTAVVGAFLETNMEQNSGSIQIFDFDYQTKANNLWQLY